MTRRNQREDANYVPPQTPRTPVHFHEHDEIDDGVRLTISGKPSAKQAPKPTPKIDTRTAVPKSSKQQQVSIMRGLDWLTV